MSKRSAQNAAPAWFAPAIQQALAPLVAEISELRSDVAVVNNRSVSLPNHPIMPRPRPPELDHAPLPQVFPNTLRELREISGSMCSACLAFYGLPDHGSVIEKRQRLAEYLGVQDA